MEKAYITIEEVRKNKIKSFNLIALMVIIVMILSYIIGYIYGDTYYGLAIGVMVSVIVVPVQIFTSKFAILALTRGQKADISSERQKKLVSIVEGLTISAGLSHTPDVYVLPSKIPNAFASGLSEKSSFIGVTQGLLDQLDDQELTGVIGHEISHIAHRDVILSQIAVALVTIIMILASIASRAAFFGNGRGRSGSKSNNAGLFALVIVLLAVLLRPLASLIANLIQLSISRKREYAADAYSVRLCGYADGLRRALMKIENVKYTKETVDELGGEQMKCMYINYPKKASAVFSTHPPIEERIRRLENMY